MYKMEIQLNLVNSKSYGQEVLFRRIESLNNREVDMKIYMYNLKNYYKCFPIKHTFLAHKRNIFLKETSQGEVSFKHRKHVL